MPLRKKSTESAARPVATMTARKGQSERTWPLVTETPRRFGYETSIANNIRAYCFGAYPPSAGSVSFKGDDVTALYIDHRNRLWCGGENAGLNLLGKDGTFNKSNGIDNEKRSAVWTKVETYNKYAGAGASIHLVPTNDASGNKIHLDSGGGNISIAEAS